MIKRHHRLLSASLVVLASALPASQTLASGFALREGSADWIGTAFVGGASKAYDASTAYTNPAGLVRLQDPELDGTISYIAPEANFSGTTANPLTGGAPVAGTNGDNVVQGAGHGGLFGAFKLNDNLGLGFGVTAPFGQRVSNPSNFVGRYQSLVSSITDIDVALAFGLKINDQLSIGAGPNINYFKARLTQALNTPLAALGDPLADVNGDDVALGFNVGLLYQFDDATRVGIDYKSRIKHDIDGVERIGVPGTYAAFGGYVGALYTAALNAGNGPAKTSITLPDSLNVGIYHQLTPSVAITAEAQWTHWSLLKQLVIQTPVGITTLPENWDDTWFAGVGFNFQLNEALTLQTGFAFDQSPVNDANRTSRIPDNDHLILSIGAKYQFTPAIGVELAYAHLFVPQGNINNAAPGPTGTYPGLISGTYDDSDNSVSLGVSVKF